MGIESMTVSAGGESVTITKEDAARIRRARNFAPDAQTAFEEKAIEDPELELLIDMRLEHAEGARLYAKANRNLKKHIEDRGYEDEVRYRCGEYVFRLESRDREGYEVGDGSTRRFAELEAV